MPSEAYGSKTKTHDKIVAALNAADDFVGLAAALYELLTSGPKSEVYTVVDEMGQRYAEIWNTVCVAEEWFVRGRLQLIARGIGEHWFAVPYCSFELFPSWHQGIIAGLYQSIQGETANTDDEWSLDGAPSMKSLSEWAKGTKLTDFSKCHSMLRLECYAAAEQWEGSPRLDADEDSGTKITATTMKVPGRKTTSTIARDVELWDEFCRDYEGQSQAYFAEQKKMNPPTMRAALKRGKAGSERRAKQTKKCKSSAAT